VECQFSVENVKGQGHRMQKKHKTGVMFHLLEAGGQSSAGASVTVNYAYAIVRRNLLSAPEHEMLGNWTDGHILFIGLLCLLVFSFSSLIH